MNKIKIMELVKNLEDGIYGGRYGTKNRSELIQIIEELKKELSEVKK